jgi:hypothetical protein
MPNSNSKETDKPAKTSIMKPMMTTQAHAWFIHQRQSNMSLDDKIEQWDAYVTALDKKWDREMEGLQALLWPFHLEEKILLDLWTNSKENEESKNSHSCG